MKAETKTVGFKAGEKNLFFHLLTACNLKCRHCYINPEQHGATMVSREYIKKWLKLFFDPQKKTNVIFLGGEPTMHPDLAFAIKKAGEIGYASVTVDSNGYLFHDILDNITPADAVLSFSLDGPAAAVNDPIRGEGSFAVCTGNLRKAVAKGFAVSLIYTVSRMNIDHLEQMLPLLQDLGVYRFFIQIIGLRGRGATEESPLQLSPDEWFDKVIPVAKRAAKAGIRVNYPKVYLDDGEGFQCAGIVADNYFLFPNRRVYRCPLCEDFPIHSLEIKGDKLSSRQGLTEEQLFKLNIPEGCVMNRLLQPGNIKYLPNGRPVHRISCCLLKQEVLTVR